MFKNIVERPLSLASALLFLTIDPDVSMSAASSSTHLSAVGPATCPPRGILVVYSARSVIEDDGVLVFRRRPVEVYTDPGQLVGSDAPIGDAALRLAVPPGNNIVAFQSHGALQQIRAAVKEGEEAIVPESLPEPRAPPVRLPTVRHATGGSPRPRAAPRVGEPEKKNDHAFARSAEE